METTTSKHSFLQPAVSVNDSLIMTLFIAAVIHVVILLSIGFSIPQPLKVNKQIEITLVNMPSKKAPKNAKHLAQDNQVGGGEMRKDPEPPKQKLASQGDSANEPPKQRPSHVESKPKAMQKLITLQHAEEKIVTTVNDTPPAEIERPKLSVEALKQQIAQLGAQIRYSQKSSEQSDIKFIKAVSTHEYAAAQYIRDWQAKIERVGRLNTPPVKTTKDLSTLMLDVGINSDGSVYGMRIRRSSGNKALDDYAKRIVRLSSPFPPLPKELLKDGNVLPITRKWLFPEGTGIEIH